MQHIRYASMTYPILPEPKMLSVLRFSTKNVDTGCFVHSVLLLVQDWCHHHMAQLQRRLSQSENVLFSSFFFCYSSLYVRTEIQKRARRKDSVWHDRPACEVTGALHGIENGAKMWPLFAVRADVLKVTLCFLKHCRIKVIDQIYIIVLFLKKTPCRSLDICVVAMKKSIVMVTTMLPWWQHFGVWHCESGCLRISYTCAVEVLSTHN